MYKLILVIILSSLSFSVFSQGTFGDIDEHYSRSGGACANENEGSNIEVTADELGSHIITDGVGNDTKSADLDIDEGTRVKLSEARDQLDAVLLHGQRGEPAVNRIMGRADSDNDGSLNQTEVENFVCNMDISCVFKRTWASRLIQVLGTRVNGERVIDTNGVRRLLSYAEEV